MPKETTPDLRTRRSIIAAALGTGLAAVATSLGRPGAVQAADGGNVLLGQTNTATVTTTIDVGAHDGPAVLGSGTGAGVKGVGDTGVWGESAGTNGVWGHNSGATGYTGGASAQADSPDGVGVWGFASTNGAGVMGLSVSDNVDPMTAAPHKTGVWGYAVQDASARGVWGQTTVGQAVRGEATTGTGVFATSASGPALEVSGKAKFTRSGKASIPKGKLSVDITVPGGLTADSLVHATLQTYRGAVAIAAVRPNYPAAGKARIYLTKVASLTAATVVAWIVTER